MNAPYPMHPQPPAPKRGMPVWVIVLIFLGVVFFFVVPVLSVLAIYGVRKYIANAKTAEARASLGQLALDARKTYDPKRGFCPSASSPVPAAAQDVSGAKYQPAPGEWERDAPAHAGFACLGFSLSNPQYYQYTYSAIGRTGFVAAAHGDLNGDGVFSTFSIKGRVSPETGQVEIAPQVEEEKPRGIDGKAPAPAPHGTALRRHSPRLVSSRLASPSRPDVRLQIEGGPQARLAFGGSSA